MLNYGIVSRPTIMSDTNAETVTTEAEQVAEQVPEQVSIVALFIFCFCLHVKSEFMIYWVILSFARVI